MSEIPMITMGMGQNVDEMSREEAIDALKLCARLLMESYKSQEDVSKFWCKLINRQRELLEPK